MRTPDVRYEIVLCWEFLHGRGRNMAEKPKRKLLVTASTFPRWEGDTEPRFVLDLASHMTDKFDITVLVPAAPGAKTREELEGVQVIRYHYFPIHKWETLCYPGAIVPRIKEKKIRALLVPFLFISLYIHLFKLLPQFDVAHAHWLIPQGVVQSFFKKPYIVTGHGGDVMSLNKGIMRKLKVRCLNRAARVTVVSEHLKKKVQELSPEIRPDVISMGVNLSQFGRQYRIPDYFGQGDKKVVLFVGRLVEIKGVTYLIDAMEKINAMLVIVGDGPLREELKRKGMEINCIAGWEKIRLLGSETHEKLKTIYASADVFAAPSITTEAGEQEGLGLTVLEAMASGLAVTASSSGGIKEVIQHTQNGLLCREKDSSELAACIKRLIADDTLRNRITDNASRTLLRYDYEEIARKFVGLYQNGLK